MNDIINDINDLAQLCHKPDVFLVELAVTLTLT